MRLAAAAALALIVLSAAALMVRVEPRGVVTIIVVGDIMLSRNVAARMREARDPLLPFRNVSALLGSSDFNFGNLESPFMPPDGVGRVDQGGWDGIIGGTSLIFAAPNRSVQALKQHSFRVVGLANNHALDQGKTGLEHTLERLTESGIQAAGAGGTLKEAWQPRTVELKERKIAFLASSYASVNDGGIKTNDHVARIEDLERMRSLVRALKSEGDYVVVAMHAGTEYTAEPGPAQVAFAHAAIDAGASVVVGSHPHWIQPVERYKDGLIFYSLGNFVFDLESSDATKKGLAAKLILDANGGTTAELYPVIIDNACCPRQATPAESQDILRRLRLSSSHVRLN